MRNLKDKVKNWSNINVTKEFFFNEYQGELNRLIKAAGKIICSLIFKFGSLFANKKDVKL